MSPDVEAPLQKLNVGGRKNFFYGSMRLPDQSVHMLCESETGDAVWVRLNSTDMFWRRAHAVAILCIGSPDPCVAKSVWSLSVSKGYESW